MTDYIDAGTPPEAERWYAVRYDGNVTGPHYALAWRSRAMWYDECGEVDPDTYHPHPIDPRRVPEMLRAVAEVEQLKAQVDDLIRIADRQMAQRDELERRLRRWCEDSAEETCSSQTTDEVLAILDRHAQGETVAEEE